MNNTGEASLWVVIRNHEGEVMATLSYLDVILHLIWMFLKLVRGKGVISPSSYLDVLKIRMEMRENDLNR